jgi:hypothetical protein
VKKLYAVVLTGTMLVGMTACKDTSGYTNPDKSKKVTLRIGNGTKLGKSNFGLWKASSGSKSCRWVVLKNGKTIASGGLSDKVMSAHGTSGGVLNANHCGWFYK